MDHPLRLLIVEDSETAAMLLLRELRRGGLTVTWERVDSAAALHTALESQPWDVVTTDHLMPQFSAPEAIALVQARQPDTPVLIVSGEIELAQAIALMKAGARDYISKNELARVVPAIAHALHEADLQRSRRRAEQALRASEARWRSLVENAPATIATIDRNNIILSINRDPLGRSADSQIGSLVYADLPPLEQAKVRQALEATFTTGQHQRLEIASPLSSGQTLWYEYHLGPVREEGQCEAAVLIAIDFTERKLGENKLRESETRYRTLAEENARLLEQARRDAETKSRLLQEVNHRVKNNLAAIIGLLYAHQRRAGGDSNQGMVDALVSQIEGLASVHDMLSASEWRALPLTDLAHQIIQATLRSLPAHKTVTVTITPTPVQVTPRQANSLALIINELATNVAKHALADRDTIRFEVRIALENEWVTLEFRDNGPGYPPETSAPTPATIGLYLIQSLTRHDLGGEVRWRNEGGAVTTLQFKHTPLT